MAVSFITLIIGLEKVIKELIVDIGIF